MFQYLKYAIWFSFGGCDIATVPLEFGFVKVQMLHSMAQVFQA